MESGITTAGGIEPKTQHHPTGESVGGAKVMLKIYLTNLGKYNEGMLVGEWLELPATDEEIEAVKSRIGINEYYEEWFITDYETDVDGLTVGEYDNLDELNELAEAIESDPEAAAALIYNGYRSAEEIADRLCDVIYIGNTYNGHFYLSPAEVVAYYYIEELCSVNIPDEIEPYFDHERYGKDIMDDGKFYVTKDGDIYEVIA